MMRACEAIYGTEQADAIEELVVAATGQPSCPCRRDLSCPLLDSEGRNPLVEFIPRQRRAV